VALESVTDGDAFWDSLLTATPGGQIDADSVVDAIGRHGRTGLSPAPPLARRRDRRSVRMSFWLTGEPASRTRYGRIGLEDRPVPPTGRPVR
jgi:hypothetical protein